MHALVGASAGVQDPARSLPTFAQDSILSRKSLNLSKTLAELYLENVKQNCSDLDQIFWPVADEIEWRTAIRLPARSPDVTRRASEMIPDGKDRLFARRTIRVFMWAWIWCMCAGYGAAQSSPPALAQSSTSIPPLRLNGSSAIFRFSDAIYMPMAARRVMNAENAGVLTATNDAILRAADAYFDLQQAQTS
jgi:hypothetical protein